MPSNFLARTRYAMGTPRRAVRRTPQWLRTTIATIAMLTVAQLASLAYAPTITLIPYAGVMSIGMVLISAVLPHMVGSKTAPWRTVVWATLVPFFVAYLAFTLTETRRTMELVAATWLLVLWLRLSGWGSYWWDGATRPIRTRWRAWRNERLMHAALTGGYISPRAQRKAAGTPVPPPARRATGVPTNLVLPHKAALVGAGTPAGPTPPAAGAPKHRTTPARRKARRAQQAARRAGRGRK